MSTAWVFDEKHYQALNVAREPVVKNLIAEQVTSLNLKTAVDVGCGLGHFSGLLSSLGLKVKGVDAREENIAEARRRFPEIDFQVLDAEQCTPDRLGRFDLVLCLGLLYHLENPFRVIRNLVGMSSQLAILEGMVYPSSEPIMSLLDENKLNDQGVNYVAFYPTEACMARMLSLSGFANCYLPSPMPQHPVYEFQTNGFRIRSMMVGSSSPLSSRVLKTYKLNGPRTPWSMPPLYVPGGLFGRVQNVIGRMLQKRANSRES